MATLDLTGLTSFIYNGSGGTLVVGGNGGDARGAGSLNLAAVSNNITVSTISLNIGNGNSTGIKSLSSSVAGTNIFNVGTFVLAGFKAELRYHGIRRAAPPPPPACGSAASMVTPTTVPAPRSPSATAITPAAEIPPV